MQLFLSYSLPAFLDQVLSVTVTVLVFWHNQSSTCAEAEQPEDWDEEEDGEWEPPKISNPKCIAAPGCGEWERPTKMNPAYKGTWYPPMIDNPEYKVRGSLLSMLTLHLHKPSEHSCVGLCTLLTVGEHTCCLFAAYL